MDKYMPVNIRRVAQMEEADLVVMFIDGRLYHNLTLAGEIKQRGQDYAILQIALGSTRNPNPLDWLPLWEGARVVWGYYDLPLKDYYRAPLGADPEIFHPLNLEREYIICMTGNYNRKECLLECRKAAYRVKRSVFHVQGCTDEEVNQAYNRSDYINGLRRDDGFELPAAEGLIAGTRPILFDNANYRHWYEGLALFIPEDTPEQVSKSLAAIFRTGTWPVKDWEIAEARRRFDWAKIVGGFWERCQ